MRVQCIVFSVWKCRGNWYVAAWAVNGSTIVRPPSHYRGTKTEAASLEKAEATVTWLRNNHPEIASFPAVREHSPEWQAMIDQKEAA